MQGHQPIISTLNALLADELTAINQYIVHSEMCDNWGYDRLHDAFEKTAIDEMKHAEKLIARILFLEGRPVVSQLNAIRIGANVAEMLENDRLGEQAAIAAYNAGIRQCQELGDSGTRELMEDILEDEERHIDWREAQTDQIAQMGVQNYLATQTK